jgi:energy-coupling factor transport system permease protein
MTTFNENFEFQGLDPRTKLAWLVLVIVVLFLFDDPIIQLAVAGMVLATAIFGSLTRQFQFKSFLGAAKALLGMLLMMIILQGFLKKGDTVLFSFPIFNWRLSFYLEGMLFGLVIASRFITISFAAMMFFITTSAYQLSIALNRMGISFKYAYLASMALERLPRTIGILNEIENAQASRGLDIEGGNFLRKIMNILPLLIPLVIISLRDADRMSLALEVRGFGQIREVTFLYDLNFRLLDKILTILAGCLMLVILMIKISSLIHI